MDGLSKAELVEKAAESLYRRLAAKFRDNAMLRGLFIDLADEEREHARRVAMLRYQVQEDPQLLARVHVNEALLDELLRETEVIAKKIVHTAFTPAEAIALVNNLEHNFAAAHAEVAAEADPWLRDFFVALAADDGRHRAMIEAMSKRGEGSTPV